MVLRSSQSKLSSFLKPALAIAEECGISKSQLNVNLWARSQCIFEMIQSRVASMLKRLPEPGQAENEEGTRLAPLVYLRARKFDETASMMSCTWDHGPELLGDGQHLLDQEVGPTKVFVTELRYAYLLRKTYASGAAQRLIVKGDLPCVLQAVEKNTAECYLEALRRRHVSSADRHQHARRTQIEQQGGACFD